MTISIAGTGCSLLDILYTRVNFASASFRKYMSLKAGDGGLAPGALVFTEDLATFAHTPWETILRDLVGDRQPESTNLGGPAIVALVNAAQLLPSRGIEVHFHAARGDDAFGSNIQSVLRRTPVNIGAYSIVPGTSPYTTVLSDPDYDSGQGERTFVNNIGAAWKFTPADLDKSFFEADILLYGATALVPNIHDGLTELLLKGRALGRLNVVTTVHDFRNEHRNPGKPWPLGRSEESFPNIDLLVANKQEILRISGQQTIPDAIKTLAEMGTKAIMVTDGPQPVYMWSNGAVFRQIEMTTMPVSESVQADLHRPDRSPGDTTGCGDNFAGGVLASMASQLTRCKPGELDLFAACAWGVCSGGFAQFYHGGTYIESRPGEKLEKISAYYAEYCRQVPVLRDKTARTGKDTP